MSKFVYILSIESYWEEKTIYDYLLNNCGWISPLAARKSAEIISMNPEAYSIKNLFDLDSIDEEEFVLANISQEFIPEIETQWSEYFGEDSEYFSDWEDHVYDDSDDWEAF